MMKHNLIPKATALTAAVFGLAQGVQAGVITTTNPNVATEIGARIRWGGTGFEASIFDNNPFGQTPTLNPTGTPVWQLNQAYKFEVTYDGSTGTLGLKVDFDRNDSFGTGESISRSLFSGTTSYAGLGFEYLSISGNEGGSTARSTVSDLVINGSSQTSISPNGGFSEIFYKNSSGGALDPITITGKLTYTATGTSQERPSWNFNFKGPAAASVPDGGTTLAMMGLAFSGLALARRRAAQ